jgi:hypothetical protein
VHFIDGSAFSDVKLDSVLIEAGNDIFHLEHKFLIAIIHHKLIRNFSVSSKIEIPRTIEILCSLCFSECKLLSSISFESNSGLKRIESFAFSSSSLQSIVIPRSVEIICSSCFSFSKLSSTSFGSNSRLKRIESFVFSSSSLQSIVIPRSVQFIDGSAFSGTKLASILIETRNDIFLVEHELSSRSEI